MKRYEIMNFDESSVNVRRRYVGISDVSAKKDSTASDRVVKLLIRSRVYKTTNSILTA